MKYLSLFLISLALLFTGCSDDDEAVLDGSIVTYDREFDATGGTGTITYNPADASVQVTSSQSWLTVSTPSNGNVAFAVVPNNDLMSRSADVTLSFGSSSQTVTVLQMGTILDVAEAYEVAGTPTITSFDLYLEGDAAVTATDSWAQARIENGQLIIEPEINPGEERTTTLVFTAGSKTVTASLTQRKVELPEAQEMLQDGSALTFAMTQDILSFDTSWSVSTEDSWLTAVREGDNVVLTGEANDTRAPRTTNVVISAGGYTFMVAVTQTSVADWYEFFLGQWSMEYSGGTATVTLIPTDDRDGYYLTGILGYIYLAYDAETHNLAFTTQILGTAGSYYLFACPYDSVSGYYTWGSDAGLDFIFNGDEVDNEFAIVDNGAWGSHTVNSFLFRLFTSTTPSSSTSVSTYGRFTGMVRMYR